MLVINIHVSQKRFVRGDLHLLLSFPTYLVIDMVPNYIDSSSSHNHFTLTISISLNRIRDYPTVFFNIALG